jgi:hypothetical protein
MAKTTIIVSDLSGEQVTEENGATVRVLFPGSDTVHVGDFTRDEVDKMFTDKKGNYVMREQQKRGRKAGSGNDDDPEGDES